MNLVELIDSLASWPTLLVAVIVYGFAPGFLLRLIVLAYERNNPRRGELVAELYSIPRLKRPFWVAEQLETALFDGVAPRIKQAVTRWILLRQHLVLWRRMRRAGMLAVAFPVGAVVFPVVGILYSGIKYVTSAGDSGSIAGARQTAIYAVMGLPIPAALALFVAGLPAAAGVVTIAVLPVPVLAVVISAARRANERRLRQEAAMTNRAGSW